MERVLTATGEVRTPYDPAALPILRAMPGARWDRDSKVWRVSVSTADLPRTLECAERLRLDVAPELVAKLAAGTQETVAASARIDAIEARSGCRLYPFQRAGVDWLARRDRALLADDMGLGKTIQVLAALPERARCLVVAPATLKLNWQAECAKWRPELRTAVLSGRGSFRWPREGELVIVNYDILPAEAPPPPAGVVLVLDEAHMVKSYKAARSKRAKALQQAVVGTGGRCWFLTGTPLMNRPTDLYGVLEALGERALGGWPKFVGLFNGWKNRWGGWEFGDPQTEVAERLRRCMIRRRKSEVLPDLPRKVRSDHWANGVSAGLQKTMDELWEDYRSELEADSLPPFQCFSAMLARMAEARIPDLLELVEQYEEQETPVVVFSAHRAPIDELGKRDGWGTITGDTPAARRQEVVEQFQDGRLRGVACTIQAGGVGITLTRASHEIFVDRDWTPALNLQAEDRCCRIGQTASSVQVTVLRSGHVLCRHMERLLERKIAMIEAAVERQQAALSAEHVRGVDERERAREEREAAELARQEEIERKAREVTVDDHMRRIESRSAGVAARAKGHSERLLTPELVTLLHRQIGFLYSQCDGAQDRDGVGFSKTDVSLGWSLAELSEWTPEQARCAERLTIIYRRQLCAGMGQAA